MAQEYQSELPESIQATGSTNGLDGREAIVESEVGGEGVVEVVAERKPEKTDAESDEA